MDFNAFDLICEMLLVELSEQGFNPPVPYEDPDGRAEMFVNDDIAYSVVYNRKNMLFELRSTSFDDKGQPTEWRRLASWLYDEQTSDKTDARSIANDFIDIARGPKRVAITTKKKKRNKNDERTVDPQFFMNRLANLFPELKDAMNQERIVYGQIRYASFARDKAAPLCESLALHYPNSEPYKRLCEIFSDMYQNGDLNVRSILTISILNNVSESAYQTFKDDLSDELKKNTVYTRKLIGKKIKPEKPKKEKKQNQTSGLRLNNR